MYTSVFTTRLQSVYLLLPGEPITCSHLSFCSTFQVGEIGIRSIDTKITQTTNPIVDNYDQDNRIMVNVILNYLLIALFLHPEMYSVYKIICLHTAL